MKVLVKDAIAKLQYLNEQDEIFFWFVSNGDMQCTRDDWIKVTDAADGFNDEVLAYVQSRIDFV